MSQCGCSRSSYKRVSIRGLNPASKDVKLELGRMEEKLDMDVVNKLYRERNKLGRKSRVVRDYMVGIDSMMNREMYMIKK